MISICFKFSFETAVSPAREHFKKFSILVYNKNYPLDMTRAYIE